MRHACSLFLEILVNETIIYKRSPASRRKVKYDERFCNARPDQKTGF